MALLKMRDGRRRIVKHEQALEIWLILIEEIEPDPEQEAMVLEVEEIYMDWRKAPDSWIERHRETIFAKVIDAWSCDRQGRPVRPATDEQMGFAKKWELWENGKATPVAFQYIMTKQIIVKPKQGEFIDENVAENPGAH